ncbi:MAG: PhoH family protein [Spirochaetaceae bacterium]|nr:PhoH family protein [Spirochaetaceae bacterium]MBQ3024724.1 PhoH family protein [Spirochaetaceae bacterium]MBQ7904137.1 PhoH family protein [Spirochaetaceae bacterium]
MDCTYTIVVPDTDLLYKVCGSNDSNLRLIEEYLGTPIFIRGNELSIQSEDEQINQKFKHIIDRILDETSEGMEPCSDMVNSILQTSSDVSLQDEKAFFNQAVIKVPGGIKTIFPKTKAQAKLIHSMRKSSLVFASGPAGSGKTFLVVAEALSQLLSQKKKSLILTRPVVEAGESLGFLPGDFEQKINPYLRPLFDSLETLLPREALRKMLESGIIEIAPLAYMRGRTLSDCIIILDEAQNTTVQQMKMFLTRIGENSRIFVTGDATQSDLPKRIPSGLVNALEILKDIDDISICHLSEEDIVRSPLVRKIIQAYEKAEDI